MADTMRCIVCGSEECSVIFECSDWLTTGEKFNIAGCKHCGFRFTVAPPDEELIGNYYKSEDYISHSDKNKGLTEHLYHLVRSFMLRRKSRLLNSLKGIKKGNLLDIGCGTGYFPAFMKENGWDASGVEVNDRARAFAKEKFGIEVIPPERIDELEKNHYDCITLWHVMEHFHDPASWFRKIDGLLKDDGYCIIALPNSQSSDARWFGRDWAAYDVPRHLWHFSPSSFSLFASGNGFRVTRTKNMPLDVFYISILSCKSTGKSIPLIRGLLTGLLLSIGGVFRNDSSSSVIYVLKKSVG